MRSGEAGVHIGAGEPGPLDAITDVPGVLVGHTTLVAGEGPLVVGRGPIRTGVTVVIPHSDIRDEPVMAGCHRLNGNGELTGLEWVRESGLLTTPVALTNTHSVGVVRDALVATAIRRGGEVRWSLPVVGETYDGLLNDMDGMHVRPEHLEAALRSASRGPVAQGNVGGGTGMVCHEFKGGIGTASRVLSPQDGAYVVGVLVQANYGARERLTVDGAPVGREIPREVVPSPYGDPHAAEAGSIIVLVATDAPLLPTQCARLAQRAGLGVARVGGVASDSSGDLFVAFSTANRGCLTPGSPGPGAGALTANVDFVRNERLTPLFTAVVDATEEAILNALLSAETMTGRDGITAHRLPPDLLQAALRKYGRGLVESGPDPGSS
jgi:D-aminopeptidase